MAGLRCSKTLIRTDLDTSEGRAWRDDEKITAAIAARIVDDAVFARVVEDLATERVACLRQLFEQLAINVALTRFFRHQVPEVAHLGLADTMNAPKSLLDGVRIPGQVVIHHEMRTLEIDAFAGGIGGEQHLHFGIVAEGFLSRHPFLAAHAAMDGDDSLRPAEQSSDAGLQVIQRVTMLGKDDELLVRRAPAS